MHPPLTLHKHPMCAEVSPYSPSSFICYLLFTTKYMLGLYIACFYFLFCGCNLNDWSICAIFLVIIIILKWIVKFSFSQSSPAATVKPNKTAINKRKTDKLNSIHWIRQVSLHSPHTTQNPILDWVLCSCFCHRSCFSSISSLLTWPLWNSFISTLPNVIYFSLPCFADSLS